MDRRPILVLAGIFAVLLALAWGALLVGLRPWGPDSEMVRSGEPPVVFLLFLALFAIGMLFLVFLIAVYVYQDAKRRGMPPLLWSLVAALVPYFIGLIVYLVVRQPRLLGCPHCGQVAGEKAVYCPTCGRPVRPLCPGCREPMPDGARFCPSCGKELRSPA
jgi:RNA polymerase subunit RPABC4/transcription elongation factor Spt4